MYPAQQQPSGQHVTLMQGLNATVETLPLWGMRHVSKCRGYVICSNLVMECVLKFVQNGEDRTFEVPETVDGDVLHISNPEFDQPHLLIEDAAHFVHTRVFDLAIHKRMYINPHI